MNSSSEFFNQQNGNNFLDQKNESMLNRLVYTDFMRRTNNNINEKQKDRLIRTVHHYMEEVYEANPRANIQTLNKEVLKAVVTDFNAYLNRGAISATSDTDTRMKEDIGSRFTALQNERTDQKTLMPPIPDFRIPIEDSNDLPAISLFEKAKKNREIEAKRENDVVKRDDSFSGTFLKDLIQETQGSGIATANPTIAKPEAIRIRPALSQDVIIPQDEILSYKENEYNLVIYSADRDWYNNLRENRYNFSVTFNPANNSQGFKYSPAANQRFHNITRIEMVKALLPAEGIDTVLANNTSNGTFGTKPYAETVLSLPSIILHIDELESNVYGTDDQLDRAFATLQYDAQWVGNSTSALNYPSTTIGTVPNTGYFAMIPKFLKCQRVYYPTPLATLTKMTIQLQRPTGDLLNSNLDTLDISGIFASNTLPSGFTAGSSKYAGVVDSGGVPVSAYYIIRTKTFFNAYNFVSGDVIQIKGINTANISGNDTPKSDWLTYIQDSPGLTIVQTGYSTSGSVITDGPNNLNYCNLIIVQNRFNDPTTGLTTVKPFGGTAAINNTFESALKDVSLTGARLINLSKQTQLTFRVITRDMDSATRIRPNNA